MRLVMLQVRELTVLGTVKGYRASRTEAELLLSLDLHLATERARALAILPVGLSMLLLTCLRAVLSILASSTLLAWVQFFGHYFAIETVRLGLLCLAIRVG